MHEGNRAGCIGSGREAPWLSTTLEVMELLEHIDEVGTMTDGDMHFAGYLSIPYLATFVCPFCNFDILGGN